MRPYLAADGQWEEVALPKGFDHEQCYVDEIAMLLTVFAKRRPGLCRLTA